MTTNPESQSTQDHMTEERICAVALDGAPVSSQEEAHLTQCATCQSTLNSYNTMARELLIAKLSQPSPTAEERYVSLFAEYAVNATGITDRLAQFADAIKASVMWNGRERLMAAGVRNASTTSYRMLYGSTMAEIELLVEPIGAQFKIEGELLPLQAHERVLPVWLELHDQGGDLAYSGESSAEGRFHIPAMAPGEYSLYLLPPEGAPVYIESLELM